MRARIRHAAFIGAPLWLTGGRLRRARSVRRYRVVERPVVLPDLPDALDGLRIAHLSDLHIGALHRPDDLGPIVDSTNRLQPDLVAITGDYIDLSLDVMDDVIGALSRLTAPLGVFLVMGNHDYLEDGPRFIRQVRGAAPLRLLVNQSLSLAWRGCRVLVAGIDFAHRKPDLARLVHRTFLEADGHGSALRLLLAHHPDAFDPACRHHVDLTLSGHTHGGQVKLSTRRGKKGSIGLGSLAFQYPHGLYRRGHCYLHVTSGVGSWFPLRLRCPAEIACLVLRNQADPLDGPSHP